MPDWRIPIGRWLEVEVAEDLPGIVLSEHEIDVVVRVGGAAIAKETIRVPGSRLHPDTLMAEINVRCGFELCRAAVREGLLGRPISLSTSLRDRLSEAAGRARQRIANFDTKVPDGVELAPGSLHNLAGLPINGETAMVIGRRLSGAVGTSVSRCSMLPVAVAAEIVRCEARTGLVIRVPNADESLKRILYAPRLIWRHTRPELSKSSDRVGGRVAPGMESTYYGRGHFEEIFAARQNPWKYNNEYERAKYEQTLAMLPETHIERALELACAEGHFTELLAPRVNTLIAADISQIALERAASAVRD